MKLAIYGYGGHAREVAAQLGESVTYFVDKEYSTNIARPIDQFDPSKYKIIVAVADSQVRSNIIQRLPIETEYFTFIHHTAILMDTNIKIGEGSFIGAYSILTTNVIIGNHAILNRANHIGHDTNIGNYFSAMPGAIVSGNVTIHDCVYLGTNASVREKVEICSDVTLGVNSGVVKNITLPGIYVGTPSKRI